jgi:ankyrin repeat protein
MAEALIKAGADLNVVSDDGGEFVPLHEAVWSSDLVMVRLFLKHGANVEARDHAGLTPLLLAVFLGQVEAVPVLLEWNEDMSATNRDGDTAFFIAAERNESIFLIFIESGRIPEDLFGGSVLCSAVRSCSRRSVQTLVEKGIAVNAPDRLGKRPLDYALEQGFSEVIGFLISHAARPALNWNFSSYYVKQWMPENWFPDLVQGLTSPPLAKSAPNILSTTHTRVCREEYTTVSESSPRVPYLWIRIPIALHA